jgi:hypothetical protein
VCENIILLAGIMNIIGKIYSDCLVVEISGPLDFSKFNLKKYGIPELLIEYNLKHILVDTRGMIGAFSILQSYQFGVHTIEMIPPEIVIANLTSKELNSDDTFLETILKNRGRSFKMVHTLDEALEFLNVYLIEPPIKIINIG